MVWTVSAISTVMIKKVGMPPWSILINQKMQGRHGSCVRRYTNLHPTASETHNIHNHGGAKRYLGIYPICNFNFR